MGGWKGCGQRREGQENLKKSCGRHSCKDLKNHTSESNKFIPTLPILILTVEALSKHLCYANVFLLFT